MRRGEASEPRGKEIKNEEGSREELNGTLPLRSPQRSLIYIIKTQITRRMNGEWSGR